MSRIVCSLSIALATTFTAVSAEAWEFYQNDTHVFELDHATGAAFRLPDRQEQIGGTVILNFLCDTSLPATEYLVNVYVNFPEITGVLGDTPSLTLFLNNARKDALPFSAAPAYGDGEARLAMRNEFGAKVSLELVQILPGDIAQYQAAPGDVAFRDAVIAGNAPDTDVTASMTEAALLFSIISGAEKSLIGAMGASAGLKLMFGVDANDPAAATDAFWNACSRDGTTPMVRMH